MKLIAGNELKPELQREVLSMFGYRWTIENLARAKEWYGNLQTPTVDPIKDSQWLSKHAFYVTRLGKLARNGNHAEPAYLLDKD